MTALACDLRTAASAFVTTVRTAMTQDHREAVRAFIEKRRPAFRGR